MKNYLGKLNSGLPLERLPKNLSPDIHLYYLENDNHYFHMLILNLRKADSVSNEENSIDKNSTPSRFTIFKISDKTAAHPAVETCDLLGELINSNYDITYLFQNMEVSFYQSDIGKVLIPRAEAACLDKDVYEQKLKQLNISLRNYGIKIKRTQYSQGHLPKSHFQNNKIPQPPEIEKLKDELYHNSFICPIKYIDCTNTEKLPKFLYHLKKEKAPTLLNAPVEDIRKGEITIYSDSAFDFKTGKFTASCVIFIKGLQGIFCSVNDSVETEDSTIPELCAMNNACTILSEMFDIQEYKLDFLSDNKNLLSAIKEAQSGLDTKYTKFICKMISGFKITQLEFEKADESNKIFRLVDREAKYFRKENA